MCRHRCFLHFSISTHTRRKIGNIENGHKLLIMSSLTPMIVCQWWYVRSTCECSWRLRCKTFWGWGGDNHCLLCSDLSLLYRGLEIGELTQNVKKKCSVFIPVMERFAYFSDSGYSLNNAMAINIENSTF